VTASATGHVVVTGGASGIGEVTALALIDEGVAVTILDAGAEAVSRMEDRLAGEDILALTCDVTDEEEVADCLSQAVDAFGPVTGLVNCAGIARDIPAEKTSAEIFRQILDVNLTGSFIPAAPASTRWATRCRSSICPRRRASAPMRAGWPMAPPRPASS
jgi:3-oxoacyl-[acyl-carrier protein] reductase